MSGLPPHFEVGRPASTKYIPASVFVGVILKNFGSQPLTRKGTPSVPVLRLHPKASAMGLSMYEA